MLTFNEKNLKRKGTYIFIQAHLHHGHLFTCAYIIWVISPPCPLPPTFSPSLPGRTCSALFSNFVEEKR
jgi:hypothetical protein